MSGRSLLAILGAGDSRRMGRPKILLPHQGRPILLHILATARAAGLSDYLIACRDIHLAPLKTLRIPPSHLHPVPEAQRARGPIGSLASLLGDSRALSQFSSEGLALSGLMVWPVDHPNVQTATLKALLQASGPLRVPVFQGNRPDPQKPGRRGHPVWIASSLWPRVQELAAKGDSLKTLFRERENEVSWVDVPDEGILRNLNRPEDLE
jgi:CTP:molybdopterin cytidylyltransferase MocA